MSRTPEAHARRVLRADGWIVNEIERVCDEDWTGQRLVLFWGRKKKATGESNRHEALIRGDTIVSVEVGWGDPVKA